ncbi:MAG TPA: PLP-dependent lyase/thiolase [Gemmataceae bacterium]|nr:PLP-dependent lyase/thiolase [Gemmataceae bacterium]
MIPLLRPPLVRLGNLFPGREVYAKCEFLAPGGSFKIRGAVHLLERLRREGGPRQLVVPSMGNTALGAAVGCRAFGCTMVGVVPDTIGRAKDEKLRALGVELVKIPAGGGGDLLRTATRLAAERGGYFVHPHLDPLWTDGYRALAAEIVEELPGCRSLIFPLGGGGLLMGLTEYFRGHPAPVRLVACEAHNYPTYAPFDHARSATIADGLVLDEPHPAVQERIAADGMAVRLVSEAAIRAAMAGLYRRQALAVEPSSAITVAFVQAGGEALEEPVCVVLTGQNIAPEDFARLVGEGPPP